MKVRDVMKTDVASIAPGDSIERAVSLMLDRRISGLPVVDPADGSLVGILSEGDLLRRSELGTGRKRPRWLEFVLGPGRMATEYAHASGRKVHEVMTTNPVTVHPDDTLLHAVDRMEDFDVKRLPVVGSEGLVGIVTRADLVGALRTVLGSEAPATLGDQDIRNRILARMRSEDWAPRATAKVRVEAGVVTLSGIIFDEREREALQVLVENTPGVRGCRDELVWVEPYSGTALGASKEPLSSGGEISG
jgi:CBS domain-containing protein